MELTQDTTARARLSVTIASGAAVSGDIYAGSPDARARGFRLLMLDLPSTWTAADIGFEYSLDGSTWKPCYDKAGTRIKITGVATAAARGQLAPAEIAAFGMLPHLRLVSLDTSTGANTNQGGARAIVVCTGG